MLPAIETAHLFPALNVRLIELLRSLDASEWEMPTVAGMWTVKDVAAHLLDTQERLVERLRGTAQPPPPLIRSNADLVAFINGMNAEGVSRYRLLAPSDLIARMEEGAALFAEHHRSLDPLAEAPFAVSWAGEQRSANWFHTAREFTERWHHQQQIRLATGRPGIMTRELYFPVLDCFMRVLPFAYREKTRPLGALARFSVAGDCGGSWYLYRGPLVSGSGWSLVDQPPGPPVSETTIPQEIAWRIFTKGIGREEAERQVRVSGDTDLGRHVLGAVAIVG